MRYIECGRLREGMVLGMPFFGHDFEILLKSGDILDADGIKSIGDIGYAGAYIEDEASAGIKPRELITEDLRAKTARETREIFKEAERRAEKGHLEPDKTARGKQDDILLPLIDELFNASVRIIDEIDAKPFEHYRYYHAVNVCLISMLIGIESGFDRDQLYELGLAALLHDIGNIFLPRSILDKKGKLTNEEFELIKSHSQMGFDYLREHFYISEEACMGALQHHENYNGTGYPNKLKRDEITVYGRIIAIAQVYDALTSSRPYRVQGYPDAAIDYMDANTGIMFDPEIFEVFRSVAALYPSGTAVELQNGAKYIVAENYPGFAARPKLRGIVGPEQVLDLRAEENAGLSITGMIQY